ncbi:MAG: arsenosugar biosynthesis radical SAM protein ArsS [Flavobacteriales bacterium]|nr:arsenosugar biosynthesis radical SAM protein ArsS [Flavobacteriales bacterium]
MSIEPKVKKPKLKSLKRRESYLSKASNQVRLLEVEKKCTAGFAEKLREHGMFPLRPTPIEILQVNVGYMCDLTCEHCHVDAGPDRKEIMTKETMMHILDVLDRTDVGTVDLTGGAPEMNPHFLWFVEEIRKRNVHVIVRSNLTILVSNKKYRTYPEFFKKHKLEVIASLPCYTQENVDKQRGSGVFNRSIEALRVLNDLGYGKEDGLALNLVFNPGGPGLPPDQQSLENDYKVRLKEDWDLEFNHLYTITNLPISRFLDYILAAGRYEEYMEKLVNAFNPAAAMNVMCRNTISVDWEGNLYDCDFNQMLQLKIDKRSSQHISEFDAESLLKRDIVLGQHCFGCTAGAGSSCQGSIT